MKVRHHREQHKKMFRTEQEMNDGRALLKFYDNKIVKYGFMPGRTYRNFGWKYGVIYRKPIKKGKKK